MGLILRALLIFLYVLFFMLATVILSSTIIIVAAMAFVMPLKSWHHKLMHAALKMPVYWAHICSGMLAISAHHQWEIHGEGDLNPQKWYVLISNHQTWLDILVLGYAFGGKIPILKFFMKKQLLWSLPVAGLACWMLGYPFMQRHTRKARLKQPDLKNQDIKTTQKACQKFKTYPTTVMNFTEGTRLTPEKHQRQQSPYLHLLKPKAAGVALVVNELRDRLRGIINVTIHYSNPEVTLLKFLLGQPCKVTVHYDLLPITADITGDYYGDREFRVYFQRWLNLIWEQKDLLLEELDKRDKR